MKTRILLSALALPLSALLLPAANIDWLGTADNNWRNAANWSGAALPETGDALTLGPSDRTRIALGGGAPVYIGSIAFTDNAAIYEIELSRGANLIVNGTGFSNTTPAATDANPGQTIRLSDGVLVFTGHANASDGSRTRIVNNKGTVSFHEDSTAGSLFYFNSSDLRGGHSVNLVFNDRSSAGNSQLTNFGENARIHFTDNSKTGTATIINRGWDSKILFDSGATFEIGTRLFNQNPGAQTTFLDDVKIYGDLGKGNAYIPGVTAVSSTIYRNNATFVSNAANTGVYISGNVIAKDVMIGCTGTQSTLQIAGHASITGNTAIAANGNSSYIGIQGDKDGVKIDGNFWIYSMNTGTTVRIGDNVEIITHGNITSNSVSAIKQSLVIIGGNNTYVGHDGNSTVPLGFRVNSTAAGATFTINGNAVINNASISIANGRNPATVDPANPGFANTFNICENAVFKTNKQAVIAGNFARLNIYDKALFETSSNFAVSGTYGIVEIHGDATVKGASVASNLFTVGGANNTLNIRGNATLSTGRIDLSVATAALNIAGTPTFEKVRLVSRATRTVNLAMGKDHAITFDQIIQVSNGDILTLHFGGNTGQSLQYNSLTYNPNFVFTEDPGIRASVIHNATAAGDKPLSLDNQNTITGTFTIMPGASAVTANHTNALDTATLELIGASTTIAYGTTITTAGELTLGGLSGDGTLSAALSEIKIGNNNHDSEFDGTLSGTGNITKIGDGTLSLTNIKTTSYSGQVAVNKGTLRVNGSLSLPSLTLAADTRLILSIAADQTALQLGTLTLQNEKQIFVAPDAAFTFTRIADFIKIADLSTSTDLDRARIFSATNARQTYILNLNTAGDGYDLALGEILAFTAFASTPNQAAAAIALGSLEQVAAADPVITQFNSFAAAADITAALNELNPSGLAAMGILARRQAAADLRLITQRTDQHKTNQGATPSASSSASAFFSYFSLRHNQGEQDGASDTPGFETQSTGITVGIETPAKNALYGVQFAYEKSEADLDYRRGKVELESLRLIGYLAWFGKKDLWLQAHASINVHDYETTRNLPTLGGQNKGSTDALGFTGSIEAGKTYNFAKPRVRIHSPDDITRLPPAGAWSHSPYARLTYDTLKADEFTEDGVAPMQIGEQKPQSLVSRLAWRLNWQKTTAAKTRIQANLDLGWEHEHLDREQEIDFRLFGAPDGAAVRGARAKRDSLVAALNLGVTTAKDLHFAFAYDLDTNADFTDHRLTATFGKKF